MGEKIKRSYCRTTGPLCCWSVRRQVRLQQRVLQVLHLELVQQPAAAVGTSTGRRRARRRRRELEPSRCVRGRGSGRGHWPSTLSFRMHRIGKESLIPLPSLLSSTSHHHTRSTSNATARSHYRVQPMWACLRAAARGCWQD
ncbi:hypothetical protein PMAYCL1PPCAC_25581, partial [Pristionchus mayeri]